MVEPITATSVSNLELSWCLHSLIERSLIMQEGSNFIVAPIIKEYLNNLKN